jgi:ZIP family zinc transporter
MTSAGGVFAFTLPTLALASVAGVIAARRTPTPGQTAVVQHLAAGIVFAATALELLPKERTEAAIPVILGFALGIGLMLALRSFARTMEKRTEARKLPYAC